MLDRDGGLRWTKQLGSSPYHGVTGLASTPEGGLLVADVQVYRGTFAGTLHAIDAAGEPRWRQRLGHQTTAPEEGQRYGYFAELAWLADGSAISAGARWWGQDRDPHLATIRFAADGEHGQDRDPHLATIRFAADGEHVGTIASLGQLTEAARHGASPSLAPLPDGGFVIGGLTESGSVLLVRHDEEHSWSGTSVS